jgi:hypothetical protein
MFVYVNLTVGLVGNLDAALDFIPLIALLAPCTTKARRLRIVIIVGE